MRAVRIHQHGGPAAMSLDDIDDPTPGDGQVVVRVEAAGVNFIDTYQRSGTYPLDLPSGLGLEAVGEVTAVGAGVTDRQVGQRVGFTDQLGAYAQAIAVPADRTVVVPRDLDSDVACALLLQGMTAHYLSHSTYPLGRDDTALVYAASGGVGRLLVQLATRRGARVIACTSTQEKADDARALGASDVIRYRDGDEVVDVGAATRELTDGRGVDVVYDSVGATTFDHSLRALARRGTLVLYGAASGPVPPVDLQTLAQHGSLFTTRPKLFDYIVDADELAWRAGALFDLARQGDLDVRVHGAYPLADVADAHRDLESGTTSGKLLLHP